METPQGTWHSYSKTTRVSLVAPIELQITNPLRTGCVLPGSLSSSEQRGSIRTWSSGYQWTKKVNKVHVSTDPGLRRPPRQEYHPDKK